MKNNPSLNYGSGYVIPEKSPSYLVGRILTIIEALGLKDTQEKSLKDLLTNEIYKISHREEGVYWLNDSLNYEIHRVINEIEDFERSHTEKNTPNCGIYNYKFKITYEKE